MISYPQRLRSRARGLVLGLLAALASGPAAGQEASADPAAIPLSEFLDLTPLALADDVQAAVDEVLLGQSGSGGSAYAGARRIEYLSLQDALVRALEKNLTIALSRSESERLVQVLEEARAVLLPVFGLSADFTRSDTHDREIVGTVIEKSFQPQTPLDIPTSPAKTAQGIPQVNQIGFRKQTRQEVQKAIAASQIDPKGADEIADVSLAIEQQLPWGSRIALTTVLTRDEVLYDNRKNSYDRDWTSALALNAAIPLPYTRNFGPYAPADTGVRIAVTDTEAAYWDIKAAVNTVLVLTESRFWEVVARLEALRTVHENRALMEAQAQSVTRQYDSAMVTRYGKAQVDAELARVQAGEEAARRLLLESATRLASLVAGGAAEITDVLLLPAGYGEHLVRQLDLEGSDPYAVARDYRPELRAARIGLERSSIERAFAETQARPDLTFLATLGLDQQADPIGFDDPAEAIGNLGAPDSRNFSVGLALNRPIGNRALRAQLEAATKRLESTGLGVRDLENQVEQSVADALAELDSARSRVRHAQANVEFAQTAYDRALRRRDTAGDVPELEVVINSRRLLEAKATRIAALVEHKIAEAALLAAQGVIANQYGLRLASNEFERYRIGQLAASNALSFFAPVTTGP